MEDIPILLYPHPLLRLPSGDITDFKLAPLDGLIKRLKLAMDQHPAAGLSAPQLGVALRVIIVNRKQDLSLPITQVMVNPVIKSQEGRDRRKEGCLSLPGIYGHVTRPAQIICSWKDAKGQPRSVELSGFQARVVCHEVDHLNGVLFIDHLSGKGWRKAEKEIKQKSWYRKHQ